MWSGRFREPLDPYFDNWQRSLKFDWQLLEQEIAASKAHALALRAAEILTATEVICNSPGTRQHLGPVSRPETWRPRMGPRQSRRRRHPSLRRAATKRPHRRSRAQAPHRPQPQRANRNGSAPLRSFEHSTCSPIILRHGPTRSSRRPPPRAKPSCPPTPICNAPNPYSSLTGCSPTSR